MRSIFTKSFFAFLVLGTIIFLASCLKDEYDKPPLDGVDPNITDEQTMSVQQLLSTFYVAGKFVDISSDKYLKGIVVSSDQAGNIYKNLIIHDENSTLGMLILIDETNMHNIYPVGRRVFVKLDGLTISDYNGTPQLGKGVNNTGRPALERIPSTLMTTHIIPGKYGFEVLPRVRKISELGPNDINTLVKIEGVEFSQIGIDKKYAIVDPPTIVNLDVVDCFNGKIVLRNSGYSQFANEIVPSKNGSITAVYGVFGSDKQLFIRDTRDVDFSGDRCGGGGSTGDQVSIKSLRDQFKGSAINLSSGFVKGIVLSDIVNKNINGQNMVVQDGDSGILLRFKSDVSVPLGSEVKVGLTGGELSEYRTLLQVQNLTSTNIEVLSAGKSVTPKVLKVSDVNVDVHESTLVKLENVTLTGGSKYSDNPKVTDASGQIDLYTLNAATFSGLSIPTGTVTVVAYVSEFEGNKQLIIRNQNDVTGGGPCDVSVATADCDGDGVPNGQDCAPSNSAIYPGASCDDGNAATVNDQYNNQCQCAGSAPGNGFEETFSGQTNNVDIDISGWVNVAVKGTRKWQGKLFSGNTYAQATAFNDSSPEMETWLITPVINTASAGTISFESAKAFWVHNGLTVWATSNFTGDPSTTTWTQVTAKVAVTGDADNTFIPSGDIDLKGFGANVRVGFKYAGSGGTNTSTFRIDNVKVK